jgi:hypothetical protein
MSTTMRLIFLVVTVCAVVLQLTPTANGAISCHRGTGVVFASSGFTAGLYSWGGGEGSPCYSNKAVGLRSLTSFSLYVAMTTGTTSLQASMLVLDASNNEVLASVDVSSQLPSVVDAYEKVEALFEPSVALSPEKTYILALCNTGASGNREYKVQFNNDGADIATCNDAYSECITPTGSWLPMSNAIQLRTEIVGVCSSAAQLALPVWLTWCANWMTSLLA